MALKESWRPILSDFYSVSDRGRVKRIRTQSGKMKNFVMRTSIDRYGYPRIALSVNGVYFYRAIHSLVAEAFFGPRQKGRAVNHLDGNKKNNSVSNLEYVTYRENQQHASRHELLAMRERHHKAKLTTKDVLEIRQHRQSQRALALKFGVVKPTIQKVMRRLTWKSVK